MKYEKYLKWAVLIAFATAVFACGISVSFNNITDSNSTYEWISNLLLNLSTELFLVAMVLLMIDRYRIRHDEKSQKDELYLKLGSTNKLIAEMALSELRSKGWLTDGSLRGRKFNRLDLSYMDLSGADLQESEIIRSNLEGANLNGVRLSKSTIVASNFKRAKLINAEISEARIDFVDFRNCNARNSDFSRTKIKNTIEFRYADLNEANFSNSNIYQVVFRGSKMRNCNFDSAEMISVSFKECDLRGSNFHQAKLHKESSLKDALLQGCTFEGVSLINTYVQTIKFGSSMKSSSEITRRTILPSGDEALDNSDIFRFTETDGWLPEWYRKQKEEAEMRMKQYDEFQQQLWNDPDYIESEIERQSKGDEDYY